MKPAYTLLIIIAVIAAMWTAATLSMRNSDTRNASAIQPGMTVEEITRLVGRPPDNTITVPARSDRELAKILQWRLKGDLLECRFVSGRLESVQP